MMMHITPDILHAYDTSMFGAALCKPFPIGSLHRGQLHVLDAWQQKFHPVVKKRTSKKRRRK